MVEINIQHYGWWIGIGVAALVLLIAVLCVIRCIRRRISNHQQQKREQLRRNESDHFVWRRHDAFPKRSQQQKQQPKPEPAPEPAKEMDPENLQKPDAVAEP